MVNISKESTQSSLHDQVEPVKKSGLLWMLFGASNLSLVAILARTLKLISPGGQVGVFQIAICRSIGLTAGSLTQIKARGESPYEVDYSMKKYVFLRGLTGYTSFLMQIWSIFLLNLGLATCIFFTQPIMAAIIAYLFQNETLNKLEILSIISALIGVFILYDPLTEVSDPNQNLIFGISVALTGAVIAGYAYMVMRQIGHQVSAEHINFWFGVWMFVPSVIGTYLLKEPQLSYNYETFGLQAGIALCGWLSMVGVTKALQIEKAGRAAAINYVQVVYAFLADYLLFGESIEVHQIVGAFCILIFVFLNALQKWLK